MVKNEICCRWTWNKLINACDLVAGLSNAIRKLLSKEQRILHTKMEQLCSSRVLLQWFEQQRLSTQQLAPMLLDLSYEGPGAGEDAPIRMLDNAIAVNDAGSFLLAAEEEDEARRACAMVLISAVRTAAALKLPVKLTAVLPLSRSKLLPTSNSHCEPHPKRDDELRHMMDHSEAQFDGLLHLSAYKVMPHILWLDSHNRRCCCSTVRFSRSQL